MDVYFTTFWRFLPSILEEISDAEYVAIDFEMTGIKLRTADKHYRATTQEEIYQQRMVDRLLVVSYSSLLFLKYNGNRLEDSYFDGIPYLSREDETNTSNAFLCMDKDPSRDDIDLEIQDEETKAFYNETKRLVRLWDEDPEGDNYLNVSNPYGDRINRFQQRLVHQLLHNEFPGKFRGYCKFNTFMQISKVQDQADMKLVGGDFAMDAADVAELDDDATSRNSLRTQLKRCEWKLKQRQPVLVGHNMLVDLCFLYRTFFETLPENLSDFSHKIHELFPRIVDTKNLVARGGHDMHTVNNLQQLSTEANKLRKPVILRSHQRGRTGYKDDSAHHAGRRNGTVFAHTSFQSPQNLSEIASLGK
ncbi:caf1 family ribonuclease [Grosmannia clavigera kw1407]|uniref:Caf1 family ribonuclease n=1 Tax=Grosmannia clavigera (strain kw1407 / UAMH 11150) TaxID=655863 RepID=F0XS77_GROCL|nr:caf1 family ribonuclease [Grosmannia clavigera kw1407]EFW99611.1 caf1 family ribonuclease [Grosmannia clavigera kw1407]